MQYKLVRIVPISDSQKRQQMADICFGLLFKIYIIIIYYTKYLYKAINLTIKKVIIRYLYIFYNTRILCYLKVLDYEKEIISYRDYLCFCTISFSRKELSTMYSKDFEKISTFSTVIALIVSIILWITFGWIVGIIAISITLSLFTLLIILSNILLFLEEINNQLSELSTQDEPEEPITSYSYKDVK